MENKHFILYFSIYPVCCTIYSLCLTKISNLYYISLLKKMFEICQEQNIPDKIKKWVLHASSNYPVCCTWYNLQPVFDHA